MYIYIYNICIPDLGTIRTPSLPWIPSFLKLRAPLSPSARILVLAEPHFKMCYWGEAVGVRDIRYPTQYPDGEVAQEA